MKNQRTVKILSLKNQAWIADGCDVAESFFDRLKGLMGRRALTRGQGLWFPRCNCIHMWGMRIPLDILFIRKEKGRAGEEIWRVISFQSNVRPWTLFPTYDFLATDTLELPVGTLQRCALQEGDSLCIS